jgi:hypothetical protein
MLKRILLILAMGVALAACSSSGGGTTTVAPAQSAAPSVAAPSEMPSESVAPS